MRASTLFALTAAILIALVIGVGIKFSGLLGRTEVAKTTTAPPQVLVAARNLFANDTIQANMVKVRAAKAEFKPVAKSELLQRQARLEAAVHRLDRYLKNSGANGEG